jgi:hypothetical protein
MYVVNDQEKNRLCDSFNMHKRINLAVGAGATKPQKNSRKVERANDLEKQRDEQN